jgi:hypothetical protein
MCHSRSPGIWKSDLYLITFLLNGGLVNQYAEGPGLPQATCKILDAMAKDKETKVRELAIEQMTGRQLAAFLLARSN